MGSTESQEKSTGYRDPAQSSRPTRPEEHCPRVSQPEAQTSGSQCPAHSTGSSCRLSRGQHPAIHMMLGTGLGTTLVTRWQDLCQAHDVHSTGYAACAKLVTRPRAQHQAHSPGHAANHTRLGAHSRVPSAGHSGRHTCLAFHKHQRAAVSTEV